MPESIERPLVYTVMQTATLLGISRTHAYELVARGDLAHVRLGRRIVVPAPVSGAPSRRRRLRRSTALDEHGPAQTCSC